MNAPVPIVQFAGRVTTTTGPGAAGLTLIGRMAEPSMEASPSFPAELSLVGIGHIDLPAALDDVTVESLSPSEVVLRSGAREWRVQCKTWQLHRDVGTVFYAAVPPRPTPWKRRTSWRVLLGISGTSPGRWLLSRRNRGT